MSSLSIFPVEVLENVTSMITTVDQVHLWQCGDRVLSMKLKKGGLKVTSLKWTSSSWMPWPRWFFTTFARVQQVEWCPATGSSFCPALEINLLPKTLLSLQINCGDIYHLLRIQNANLNELLPMLRTLDIIGIRIHEENLKHLPQNLIALSMVSDESRISGSIFRDLPSTLEVLKLGFCVKDTEEHGNDLPTGLKELVIYDVEASYEWLKKLPHSLTKLHISTGSTFDWSRLPPLLVELEIRHPTRLVKSMIPQLPQSLKTLNVRFDSPITDEDIALLPKTLVRLDLSPSELTHVGLQQLPVSITRLNTDVSATHPEILSFYNPDSKSIFLKQAPDFMLRNLKLFPLPIKLERLDIEFISGGICALLPATLRIFSVRKGLITSRGASKLPKSIVEFNATFGVFDDNETIAYLSYIPKLSLICERKFGEEKFDKHHLEMLQDWTEKSSLNENWLSYLRPATKLPNSASSTVTPNFRYLPAGAKEDDEKHRLTHLSIECQESRVTNPFLGPSVFESLPRFVHLETLRIDSRVRTLPSSCFRFIPENVTELVIGLLHLFPTKDELAMLPKRLKRLEIEIRNGKPHKKFDSRIKSPWTDEVLQALPRTLQFFKSNGRHPCLTPNMNQYAPPYLQGMARSHRDLEFFQTPIDRLHVTGPNI